MALPREPRQKMINMMYLVLTALLALNVSSEILNAFKTVNKSWRIPIALLINRQRPLWIFEEQNNRSCVCRKAQVWYPKAQQVQTISKTVFTYIQGLKDRILTEAGGDPKKLSKNSRRQP
jgi:gliding motility-associated protein GldM